MPLACNRRRRRPLPRRDHSLRPHLRRHDLPYTGTRPPRVSAFCGDARKAIVAATSSTFGHLSNSALGIDFRFAGVSMMLGTTAFTQMRSLASSSARLTVRFATAALLAE